MSEQAVDSAINIGCGRPVTVNEVAAVLTDGLRLELEPELPGQYRSGDIRYCYADMTRAEELLESRASIALEDGMRIS